MDTDRFSAPHALLQRLAPRERRGSKPRCHALTHGKPQAVAARLQSLVSPWATLDAGGHWMPQGFEQLQEAQLPDAPGLLPAGIRRQLARWWLPDDGLPRRTPNFDIAATCSIEGRPGLLLVEAKAHDVELLHEAAGRRLADDAPAERRASHRTIAQAIAEANIGLQAGTGQPWHLSRDRCYQMSNRFAWSWKLASLGVPVVLVYLGFLRADEMADRGRPFADHGDWERLVREHGSGLFDDRIWNARWLIEGTPFTPLILSTRQALTTD